MSRGKIRAQDGDGDEEDGLENHKVVCWGGLGTSYISYQTRLFRWFYHFTTYSFHSLICKCMKSLVISKKNLQICFPDTSLEDVQREE